jgi:TonB family protein
MTTQRDSTGRWDDTQVRIVSHSLQVTVGGIPRRDDVGVRKASGVPHSAPNRHVDRGSLLRKVVLVDRDVDALREIAVALRDQYDFHVTISGNEALNLLRNGAIDAIVVGQTLYSSTGLNVLAEARRCAPHTQRVLLANAVEATDIERDAAPAQPFRILHRPCTPEKLLEMLEAADDKMPEEAEVRAGERPRSTPSATADSAAAAARTTRPVQTPPTRSGAAAYHDDYEHVILETPPELPRRRTRGAAQRDATVSGRVAETLPIVVYTDNIEFYQSICAALQNQYEIRLATQLERAVEMAEMGACPILMTDRAGTQNELQRISIAIRASEPALVTIASGTPNHGLALRKLLNTPALHSFLPKPLSAPLVRLTVESARRHYIQSKTPMALPSDPEHKPGSVSPLRTGSHAQQQYLPMQSFEQNFAIEDRFDFRRLIPYAGIALLVLVVLGAAGWYLQHRTHEDAQVAVLIDAELDLAKRAYNAGDFVAPDNANALYFYRRVLNRDPAQADALKGVDNIVEKLVEQTERQLTEDKLDAAAQSAALLRELRPDHKRLAFLEGQINKTHNYRQAQKLAEQSAEVARVEAAKATAAQARMFESRTYDAQNSGLISNATQRSQAVTRWLATARQRISQGKLVAPESDSAEYYFRLAERADPNNTDVDQGLREIGARLLTDAQGALTRQQIDLARRQLTDAARFAPDANAVARLQVAIETATNANIRSNFLRLALQRTRENSLFEPAQDSAKYYLSQLQRLDANGVETQQATRAIALKLIDNANQATGQRQFNIAVRLLDEVRRLGFAGTELADADARLQQARAPTAAASSAAAAAPRIVKSVPAKFPEEAMSARVSGWVDVGFKINAAGDVYDAVAMGSSPAGPFAAKFERAAIAAISQYKFERRPISETQTQSMVVRVQFKLQQ